MGRPRFLSLITINGENLVAILEWMELIGIGFGISATGGPASPPPQIPKKQPACGFVSAGGLLFASG